MIHVGVGRGEALPWVLLALGANADFYQGFPGYADGPTVYSGFVGVGVPRAAGLLMGVRQHWVREDLPVGEFEFTSAEVRIVSARRALFFSLGGRVRLSSTRPDVDDFAGGPRFSLFVELGWSIGGHGLSR